MPAVKREFDAAVDALRAGDEDAVWQILSSLGREPDACEYAIGRLDDPDPVIRETACDLVGMAADANENLRSAAAEALLAVSAPASIESLVWALGRTYDARVLPRLLNFEADPDAAVRLAVASSLPKLLEWGAPEPSEVIDALIALSSDPDDEVRDWATFGLGQMTDADGPEVRAALLERSADRCQDAREEGVCGLARRRDPRGITLLGDLLAEELLQVVVVRTAALVGDQSYLPLLGAFDAGDPGVASALRECDPVQRAARDDFAWRLMDVVATVRPDLEPSLYCERFEPGIWLDVALDGERCTYLIDALIDVHGGDVDLAVASVVTAVAGA